MSDKRYKVVVYLKTSLDKPVIVENTSRRHAREYARHVQERGARVTEPDAEVYYPVHEIFKVKVMAQDAKVSSEDD
ncbi:MAG: hypothetical protein ACYSWU_29295 [Planctomycetota bacterium]|jgi:hypothetical protein